MNIEQLRAVIDHPATKLGMSMLLLAAPYNEMNKTEIYGIPAGNIIFACAAMNIAHALVGCAFRFFPNGIHLQFRVPIARLDDSVLAAYNSVADSVSSSL